MAMSSSLYTPTAAASAADTKQAEQEKRPASVKPSDKRVLGSDQGKSAASAFNLPIRRPAFSTPDDAYQFYETAPQPEA